MFNLMLVKSLLKQIRAPSLAESGYNTPIILSEDQTLTIMVVFEFPMREYGNILIFCNLLY